MSTLTKHLRPAVSFDPANADHRSYYRTFLKTSSWKDCPVIFLDAPSGGNLMAAIQRQLVEYYLDKEFAG